MVLQAINPVLESTLGRIRDLEDREAARMSRAMEQTPEPEHPTPQRHAGAPQSSGQVQPLHANCKGVHSLMPDLGRVLLIGGLASSSLRIPPEV